jgi:hypothetical protein
MGHKTQYVHFLLTVFSNSLSLRTNMQTLRGSVEVEDDIIGQKADHTKEVNNAEDRLSVGAWESIGEHKLIYGMFL